MARKTIKELKSHKFSVDVGGENKIALDILSENMKMKYGPTINLLISGICRLHPNVKRELLEFCQTQYISASETQVHAGVMENKELEEQKAQYLTLAKLINDGNHLSVQSSDRMRKVKLKDGYLIIPSNWIVLNEDEGNKYAYAGVVECRNSGLYNVPHFVFLNEYKYGCDYNEELYEYVHSMCIKAWPSFEDIIKKQVKPIPNPLKHGDYLNVKEFLEAPTIGHFHLPESNETNNPVCGAVIIRTK